MPLSEDLEKYARVAVEVGVGLRTGDRLVVTSPTAVAEFTRLLAEIAYESGAANVDVLWTDDEVTKSRFSHGSAEAAAAVTGHSYLMNHTIETGDLLLSVRADDPNLLAGLEPERVAGHQKVNGEFMKPVREAMATLRKNWSVVSAPSPVWATSVFPHLDEDDAIEAMWQAIFRVCRIDQPDPVGAWRAHVDHLAARSAYLNDKAYDSLRYEAPGTDLRLGLPVGHVWLGGETVNPGGGTFIPNIPTEEVFTAPHRLRADGTVTATKPLSLFGTLVEGFAFEMAEGKVMGVTAAAGKDLLETVVGRDDSTARFGEAAIVPQSSNVAREGLIWRNTLYDENDACHLALGEAYPVCLDGGVQMSIEERAERGLNESSIHVDFVVGSEHLDVYGVKTDGSEELILARGEWGFEL